MKGTIKIDLEITDEGLRVSEYAKGVPPTILIKIYSKLLQSAKQLKQDELKEN